MNTEKKKECRVLCDGDMGVSLFVLMYILFKSLNEHCDELEMEPSNLI